MKKNIFLVLIIINANLVFSQGTIFFEGTWAEALEKAKQEDKLLFVDAHTAWCGPCRKMKNEILPKKEAGDYLNARFINLSMDLEEVRGLVFSLYHKVNAYPSFLYIDYEGNVVHREIGFKDVARLRQMSERALEKNKQWKQKQMEWETAGWNIKDKLIEMDRKQPVYEEVIHDLCALEMRKAILKKNRKRLKVINQRIAKIEALSKEEFLIYQNLIKAERKEKQEDYVQYARQYVGILKLESFKRNFIASLHNRSVGDKSMSELALSMAEELYTANPSLKNQVLYVKLLTLADQYTRGLELIEKIVKKATEEEDHKTRIEMRRYRKRLARLRGEASEKGRK